MDLHLVWDPCRHKMDDHRTANSNQAPIHPMITRELWSHFIAKFFPVLFRNVSPPIPSIPSTEQQTGAKKARLSALAVAYLAFFSFSAVCSTSLGLRLQYDWASVSITLPNIASAWGNHTPQKAKSATGAGEPALLSDSFTTITLADQYDRWCPRRSGGLCYPFCNISSKSCPTSCW